MSRVLARRPRRERREPDRALLADQVLTTQALEPMLGQEMARGDQVEYYPTGTWGEDPHPSKILQQRSEGTQRLGELYEQMTDTWAELGAMVLKRTEATMGLPRRIVPADSSPRAREIAEFTHRTLARIPNLTTNLEHQLEMTPKGISFDELVYERLSRGEDRGAIVPVDMIDRPMHRFAFRNGVLHVRQRSGQPILAPPGKFLVGRSGSKDSPWGKPLLDRCYWVYFISKHGWKWWSHNVEKWASPTAIAKYPAQRTGLGESQRGADGSLQARALQIARAFQSNYALAIPENFVLELLEATRSGDGGYGPFIGACTKAAALVILGEVNTSGLRPGVGAYASDRVSNEIRLEKVKLDAKRLGSTVTDQLIRWLVELNYGIDAPRPRMEIAHVDAEDREQRRAGIELVLNAGEAVPKRYFYLTAQVPEPAEGEEVIERRAASAPPTPPPPPDPTAPAPAPVDPPPAEEASNTTAAAAHGGRVILLSDLSADLLRTATQRDDTLRQLANGYRAPWIETRQAQQDLLLDLWDRGAFAEGTGLTQFAEAWDPTGPATLLHTVHTHGFGLAFQHLIADGIPAGSFLRPTPAPEVTTAEVARPAALAAPPPGITEARDPSTAEAYWRDLLGLDPEAFAALDDGARRHAFTVAGVTDAAMLLEIQALTERAVAEGWTRDRFRDALAELYERRGMTPTSDWHADLILQQAMSQANAWARWQNTVNNPLAHRLTPYLYWATIGDGNVRNRRGHNHEVMHEYTAAITHDIWKTWWYPAGFNCRCYVGAIVAARARSLGLTGAEPFGPWPSAPEGGRALPDPGFGGFGFGPSLDVTASITEDRLRQVVQQARESRSPDLLAALRALLRRLLGAAADVLGLDDDGNTNTRRAA